MANYEDYEFGYEASDLVGWIMGKCEQYREHYESNYERKHDEYYRLFRGIWDGADVERQSERSRIISPALQNAVESGVAEIEEATFGRGKFFDISDDMNDQDRGDIQYLRNRLHEEFAFTRTRKAVADCLLNAAIYGTGIAEMVLEEVTERVPASQPIMEGAATAVGIQERTRTVVKLLPIQPQNFLIDPASPTIEDALGVAIDQFVPMHLVEELIEEGVYEDVDLQTAPTDIDMEADKELSHYPEDRVRITKWYGKVPRIAFEDALEQVYGGETVDLDDENYSQYVEAVVVIANGADILKVEENPYMMQDRPVVAFSWDTVPNRFWGRGVCEKGYNIQKALDTEMRARIDALALTIHPMMAIDATRLPRGMKPEVRPGKMFLTNGNPAEVLQPFKFGQLDQTSFVQTQSLENMLQRATGSIDSTGVTGSVNGEATAAGISMSLGAVIKKHKRTLVNFQESFLEPMVYKTAHRLMQFNPDEFPARDYKFKATSSLGIIAREYEVTQIVQLLQTTSPDSPIYPVLIETIIDNLSINNREELITRLRQSQQPTPEQQQAAQQQQQLQQQQLQLQLAKEQATAAALQAQAAEANARAEKYKVEGQVDAFNAETNRIKAVASSAKDDVNDKEFEKRMRLAELSLKKQKQDAESMQKTAETVQAVEEAVQPSDEEMMMMQMMQQQTPTQE